MLVTCTMTQSQSGHEGFTANYEGSHVTDVKIIALNMIIFKIVKCKMRDTNVLNCKIAKQEILNEKKNVNYELQNGKSRNTNCKIQFRV